MASQSLRQRRIVLKSNAPKKRRSRPKNKKVRFWETISQNVVCPVTLIVFSVFTLVAVANAFFQTSGSGSEVVNPNKNRPPSKMIRGNSMKLHLPKSEKNKEKKDDHNAESAFKRRNHENAHTQRMKHTQHLFRCEDGTTDGVLNDDFCDCPDGSDEPATPACSHILIQKRIFHCKDGKSKIFTSRINDGVIDCEDGSDETNLKDTRI